MGSRSVELAVKIVGFVCDHQPPIVACELVDADGQRHAFIDKVWIFLDRTLDANSAFPHDGVIRCVLTDRWRASDGRVLARITTRYPDSVESSEGRSEFTALMGQLSPHRAA